MKISQRIEYRCWALDVLFDIHLNQRWIIIIIIIIMAIIGTSAPETNGFNEKLLFTGSSMPCHYSRNECLTWGFLYRAERKKKQKSKILINRFRCHKVNSSSRHSVVFSRPLAQNLQFGHYDPNIWSTFSFGCCSFFNPVVLFMYFPFVIIFVLICWSTAYCHSD